MPSSSNQSYSLMVGAFGSERAAEEERQKMRAWQKQESLYYRRAAGRSGARSARLAKMELEQRRLRARVRQLEAKVAQMLSDFSAAVTELAAPKGGHDAQA